MILPNQENARNVALTDLLDRALHRGCEPRETKTFRVVQELWIVTVDMQKSIYGLFNDGTAEMQILSLSEQLFLVKKKDLIFVDDNVGNSSSQKSCINFVFSSGRLNDMIPCLPKTGPNWLAIEIP